MSVPDGGASVAGAHLIASNAKRRSGDRRIHFAVYNEAFRCRLAEERLSPILMTALVTSLALVPIVLGGDRSGHEIEHPMAVVILGGLVTSTVLNVFLLPAIYLRYGQSG